MISNLLPPSHFLHDAKYLDYIISPIPLIYPLHEYVAVMLLFHVYLCIPSTGFVLMLSAETYNITSRRDYYSVECLYPLFLYPPLAHTMQ